MAATNQPIAFVQVTDLTAARAMTDAQIGFTVAQLRAAAYAVIEAEAQNVRYRPDGDTTAPTATVGHVLPAGTTLQYQGDLFRIRFIQVTAGAKLNISLYDG